MGEIFPRKFNSISCVLYALYFIIDDSHSKTITEQILHGSWKIDDYEQDSFILKKDEYRFTCNTYGASYSFGVGELRKNIGDEGWEFIDGINIVSAFIDPREVHYWQMKQYGKHF